MQNKIAKQRKKAGLTQVELALKLNVAQSTLSSWESGKLTPSMDSLGNIAKILQCDIFDLMQNGKKYAETRPFSDFDNEEILEYFKEIDELINATRYMTEDDRHKLLNIAKTVFPEAFEKSKTKALHYNPVNPK